MASRTTTSGKWYPPNFPENQELSNSFKVAFDTIYGVQQQSVRGATGGMAVASGITTVTGAGNGIATGLSGVSNVVAGIGGNSAINEWVTARATPNARGKIDLFVWKPTAAGDNTPVASTTARQVSWIAFGTLEE